MFHTIHASPVPLRNMRAVTVQHTGADYQLALEEVPMPIPAAHQVRIKVAYAGVNRADAVQAAGKYRPPVDANPRLGLEVSGTIDVLGAGVLGWGIGDEVCALTDGGGYAEYVCVHQTQVLSAVPRLDLRAAASIPEAAAAGLMALIDHGALAAGERVLIQGAAGNIGPFMVQMARALGAQVLATAGSDEKCRLLQSYGAYAIHYTKHDIRAEVMRMTQDKGVDVIIDPLGAGSAEAHLTMLARGGRLVTMGFLQGATLRELPISAMLMKSLRWSAFSLRGQTPERKAILMAQVRKQVLPWLATGAIVPCLDEVFPLDQAMAAHLRMKERLHCGKILLEVQPSNKNLP